MKKTLIWVSSIILFIELLDTTLLYACFVPIAHDFGIPPTKISFPVLSYIVGTCLFIPMVSWLSHRYNRIQIIVITLLAFALFSFFCGIATNIYFFSLFRFFQGIAISIAASMIIVVLLSLSAKDEIVKIMAVINIPALLGTAIGPFIGAIFSYYLSWRVAFLVNVPLCFLLAGVLKKQRTLAIFSTKTGYSEFDWWGFFLIASALILSSMGFEKLSYSLQKINFYILGAGIIFALAYIFLWQKRQKQFLRKSPISILDLQVFKNNDFLFGTLVNVFARASICGIPILMSIILQQYYGYSVLKAGVYLAIIAVSAIFAKFISSLISIIGVHRSVNVSTLLTALSIILLSPLKFWIGHDYLWLPCVVLGFSMSLLYTSMNSVLYISLENAETPNASNLASMIQQFSVGLGIVVAVGGFQLLMVHQTFRMPSAALEISFYRLCDILAFLMLFNLFFSLPFNFYHKKKLWVK